MAINLVHRPDLDDRVEKLAARFGLKGRGRKTAIIEKALAALEERAERAYPDRAAVTAALDRYIEDGPRLRQRLVGSGGPLPEPPLSLSLQRAHYDDAGLPK